MTVHRYEIILRKKLCRTCGIKFIHMTFRFLEKLLNLDNIFPTLFFLELPLIIPPVTKYFV